MKINIYEEDYKARRLVHQYGEDILNTMTDEEKNEKEVISKASVTINLSK